MKESGLCFFVSDLHGSRDRYAALFRAIAAEKPQVVFLGGDLLPSHGFAFNAGDFLRDYMRSELVRLRNDLGDRFPKIFTILGNDDSRSEEDAVLELEHENLWRYIHNRKISVGSHPLYGYAFVPPTPFHLKDWEKYDVSRYVDPGCVDPLEGRRTHPVPESEIRYTTIQKDLDHLAPKDADISDAVFLFHAPPYQTNLDRAALDGKMVDHAPLDVHVGSIAVKRFIETRQPLLTMHGHIHESARITGSWQDRIGRTCLLSAAHDGPELALVRFELDRPRQATRELL